MRDRVPKRYVLGTRVRSQRTAVFFADCASEAGSSQSDYCGAASRDVLILVRTYGAFVSPPPPHPPMLKQIESMFLVS